MSPGQSEDVLCAKKRTVDADMDWVSKGQKRQLLAVMRAQNRTMFRKVIVEIDGNAIFSFLLLYSIVCLTFSSLARWYPKSGSTAFRPAAFRPEGYFSPDETLRVARYSR